MRNGLLAGCAACFVIALVSTTGEAAYREPRGVFTLFPRGLIKRVAMPGRTEGYMFKTFRQPILVAAKERSHLAVITNGVDDKTWSFDKILAALLRNYCGIRNAAFGTDLIKKTYAAEPLNPGAKAANGRAAKPYRRQAGVANGCRVTIQIEGARWRKVTATFEPAK